VFLVADAWFQDTKTTLTTSSDRRSRVDFIRTRIAHRPFSASKRQPALALCGFSGKQPQETVKFDEERLRDVRREVVADGVLGAVRRPRPKTDRAQLLEPRVTELIRDLRKEIYPALQPTIEGSV
jgi:hypothetical protein